MSYSKPVIGIYAEEYLQLLELMMALDKDMPQADLRITGTEELTASLPAEAMEQISKDVDELLEADVVILLSPLPDEKAFLEKYDGSIIDASDSGRQSSDSDVLVLANPLLSLLNEIADINDNLHITLGLPLAIYGREGIDMLMQETRSVFTFEEDSFEVLPMRIAFNMHFYGKELPGGKWAKSLEQLSRKASFNLRLNPVSTVFVADIYCKSEIELPEGLETYTPDCDFSLEDVNRDSRIAMLASADGSMCTLIGDYLYLKTEVVFSALKEALGGVE